jgi:hypothetical protein
LDLLTPDELESYESHMKAMEGGDLDQKSADHSDEESEEEDVRKVVGPVTRRKNQELANRKVPDWQTEIEDAEHVAIILDAINCYSPSE